MNIPSKLLFADKLNINLDVQLGSDLEANNYMEDLAYFVRDFLVFYTDQTNLRLSQEKIEYLIYLNDYDQRISWQRALVELVRYAANDDGDMVGLQTGLNLISGSITDLKQIRGGRELSGRLHRILSNSGLLYGGTRNWVIPTTIVRGTDF
jgi:hypothetical protein